MVPVVAGQQRKVYGVIHGASSSGHTLFVEPLETIDLNNELVRLREEEQREVPRILRELTEVLQRRTGRRFKRWWRRSAAWICCSRKPSSHRISIASFRASVRKRIAGSCSKDARHPLLQDVLRRQKKPILPISLALDEKQRTLLISGPNTGGKTVSMKTVGLLALMAQAAVAGAGRGGGISAV